MFLEMMINNNIAYVKISSSTHIRFFKILLNRLTFHNKIHCFNKIILIGRLNKNGCHCDHLYKGE